VRVMCLVISLSRCVLLFVKLVYDVYCVE